jgi:hypothetical protein
MVFGGSTMNKDSRSGRTNWLPIIRRIGLPGGRRGFGLTLGALAVSATMLYAPAALAFPHYAEIGTTKVYSTEPILPVLEERIERADRLLARSLLYEPGLRRTIVLTDGGWRWRVMALGYSDAVALRRPFSSLLIFHRSHIAADRVRNSARSLSGTIAHESVHLLTARRFGELRLMRMPQWKREGYADYVAREPSDRDGLEAEIRARSPDAAVLKYYEARRRVAKALDEDGQSVGQLLRSD